MADRLLSDWLESYLVYTQKQESPEKLHFWTGISLLSAALKRQVWMERVGYQLFTNTYVLFVAESAQVKKSTAIDIGIKLIRAAVPDLYYISGSMTPEGLLKHLNRTNKVNENGHLTIAYDSHVLIHADELAELFGYDRQRASRFTILLTKIYGAQAEHTHTLATEGQLVLKNLYPTLLAATDPRNLKVLPEEAVGGLIGRMIFVTAQEPRAPIAWGPDPASRETREQELLYERLKSDLERISQLSGEMFLTPAARTYFATWYNKHAQTKQEDSRVDAFRARCHDTALKVAMLLSIAKHDKLVLDELYMARGIEYIERQIPEFGRVANWAVASTYAQNRARFIDTLRRQGGVGMRRQMLKLLALPLEDITILETSLEQEGTLTIQPAGGKMIYRLSKQEMGKETE